MIELDLDLSAVPTEAFPMATAIATDADFVNAAPSMFAALADCIERERTQRGEGLAGPLRMAFDPGDLPAAHLAATSALMHSRRCCALAVECAMEGDATGLRGWVALSGVFCVLLEAVLRTDPEALAAYAVGLQSAKSGRHPAA